MSDEKIDKLLIEIEDDFHDKMNEFSFSIADKLDLLVAQAKLKGKNDLFDELYFEMFDEIKYYSKLKYKKDMIAKFIKINEFFCNKAKHYKKLSEGKE